MLNIEIKTIPHEEQRYETIGDWWEDDKGVWQVRVSKLGNPQYELLVALHELVEMALCLNEGIPEELVTGFDVEFEENRLPGNDEEPGDQPEAPYHTQHLFATGIEKIVAAELRVLWKEYDAAIVAL